MGFQQTRKAGTSMGRGFDGGGRRRGRRSATGGDGGGGGGGGGRGGGRGVAGSLLVSHAFVSVLLVLACPSMVTATVGFVATSLTTTTITTASSGDNIPFRLRETRRGGTDTCSARSPRVFRGMEALAAVSAVAAVSGEGKGEGGGVATDKRAAAKSALLGLFGEDVKRNGNDDKNNEGGGGGGGSISAAVGDPVLACPSTLSELTDGFRLYGGGAGPAALSVSYKSSEKLPGTRYKRDGGFIDFVEDTAKPIWSLDRGESVKEGTFQRPLVSWLYERGWRQSFNANGFPGIDEEFRQVEKFFLGTGSDGGTVVDLSCGSGLMTRRLVASKRYSRVIGGDLSPSMLTETARRFREEGLGSPELIRCDVSRLPLKTDSLDGVHAGAALHCWSKLEESLSEVYRVLKPGKGFFATTFLTTSTLRNSSQSGGFKFFELDELERLMLDAGFADVQVSKNGLACAIVRAKKGEA